MIMAYFDNGTLVIGLSEGNLDRMRAELPLHITSDKLKAAGIGDASQVTEIFIIVGETEIVLVERLAEMMDGKAATKSEAMN